ncbi:MAG: imidazole glycerol phosphate synthase subunit HisH [Polyangiaceae bacterium]
MIGVVDLDMGNLRSVANGCAAAGCETKLVRAPGDVEGCTHLVMPGVGSFKTAIDHLDAQGLRAPLTAWAREGKPLLGICLGMQLLATRGDEGGGADGLALVAGHVRRLDPARVPAIPHVGWNEAKLRRTHPVFDRVKGAADFYYVHSYHLAADDDADVLATCEYGGSDYTSVVARGSVIGVQFHPEKSQASGLRVLENFCYWDGAC